MHKAFYSLMTVPFLVGALCYAQNPAIVGYDSGVLEFQSSSASNYFTLEFAQQVGGPWTNWAAVSGQPITGAVMSVPTPIFFRIRESSGAGTPRVATESCLFSTISNGDFGTLTPTSTNWQDFANIEVYVPPSCPSTRGRIAFGTVWDGQTTNDMPVEFRYALGTTTSTTWDATLPWGTSGFNVFRWSQELRQVCLTNGWCTLRFQGRRKGETNGNQLVMIKGISLYSAYNQ